MTQFIESFAGGLLGAVAGVLLGVPAAVSIAKFWAQHPVGKAVNAAFIRTIKPMDQEPPAQTVQHPPTRKV